MTGPLALSSRASQPFPYKYSEKLAYLCDSWDNKKRPHETRICFLSSLSAPDPAQLSQELKESISLNGTHSLSSIGPGDKKNVLSTENALFPSESPLCQGNYICVKVQKLEKHYYSYFDFEIFVELIVLLLFYQFGNDFGIPLSWILSLDHGLFFNYYSTWMFLRVQSPT